MGIYFHEPLFESESVSKDEAHRDEPTVEDLERMDYGFGPITFDTDSVSGKTIASLPINGFSQQQMKIQIFGERFVLRSPKS